MTEQELFKKIYPFIDGYTEGLNWDFKETIDDTVGIIKDILAFSNSDYDGDSYIIIGIKESDGKVKKVKLSNSDRTRLNTDSIYLYLPDKWDLCGLSERDLSKIKQYEARIVQQLTSSMLLTIPKCEFMPLQIKKSRWLYIIIVKKIPGVFISKKDLCKENSDKPVVKQGVIYIRVADTTLGADSSSASATEYIRIWKNYIDWLESPLYQEGESNESN